MPSSPVNLEALGPVTSERRRVRRLVPCAVCAAIDWETERLLALVKVHFRQLDPAARRRFGEAVLGMVGSEPAEG